MVLLTSRTNQMCPQYLDNQAYTMGMQWPLVIALTIVHFLERSVHTIISQTSITAWIKCDFSSHSPIDECCYIATVSNLREEKCDPRTNDNQEDTAMDERKKNSFNTASLELNFNYLTNFPYLLQQSMKSANIQWCWFQSIPWQKH